LKKAQVSYGMSEMSCINWQCLCDEEVCNTWMGCVDITWVLRPAGWATGRTSSL